MTLDDFLKSEPQMEKLLLGMPKEIRLRSSLKRIAAGATIVRKGGKLKYVYILIKGDVKVANEFPNGRIYTYARFLSISFIGELEVLAGEMEHASTVEAVTTCRVLVITAEDFMKWMECDHSVLMVVSQGLAKKMYPNSSENGTIIFLSGIRKLQVYIIKYCREEQKDIELFLINRNRQQIADEIGTSVKTVNRCVEKLKAEGLILIRRGKIYINKEQYNKLLAIISEPE